MKIEVILVPVEKINTADNLKDDELLRALGFPMMKDVDNFDPARVSDIIAEIKQKYPAETGVYAQHTDICPVTKERYGTMMADGRTVHCRNCARALARFYRTENRGML